MVIVYLTLAIYTTAAIIVFNQIRTGAPGGAITALLITFIAYEVAAVFPTASILVALSIISRHIIVSRKSAPAEPQPLPESADVPATAALTAAAA